MDDEDLLTEEDLKPAVIAGLIDCSFGEGILASIILRLLHGCMENPKFDHTQAMRCALTGHPSLIEMQISIERLRNP